MYVNSALARSPALVIHANDVETSGHTYGKLLTDLWHAETRRRPGNTHPRRSPAACSMGPSPRFV